MIVYYYGQGAFGETDKVAGYDSETTRRVSGRKASPWL